jgi:hypothetical protein
LRTQAQQDDAANIVGGNNHGDLPFRKCYAYYRMKHFAEAVKECTALIVPGLGLDAA